ncbi:LEA type 2 family protein [Limibacter armeniacum]|uniref:LEA type 2 family protein n=1 Tax=Limibacter armeniacum TaxID=466084 RepID=UPI002FE508D5
MKRNFTFFLIFATLMLSMTSCGVKEPEFRSIRNVEMISLEDGNILLKADADIYNPNGVSLTIKEIHVDVMVNDELIGTVDQFLEREMPKKDEVALPLEVKFPPKLLFSNFLTGLMNMATGQDFEINYVGYVKTKAMGISFTVPVKSKQKIKLNS